MRYVCSVCGYVYDEAREKTAFSDLPDSWKCPVCKAAKAAFVPEAPKEAPEPEAKPPAAPGMNTVSEEEHFTKLSVGQLAALCSNLARGCEKQYRGEEASLFTRLAEHFTQSTPPDPETSMEALSALMAEDIEKGYPALRSAADALDDRGTNRICVWGEKVTRMLLSLLSQYESEGEAFLRDTPVWVCSVCGFVYVGGEPPEICPVCKVPSWKFDQIEGREPA